MTEPTIHRSGYVRRYHSNADLAHLGDTDAHHHGQVVQIIFQLEPRPSLDLLYEAAHHDCGELDIGDMSALAKCDYPVMAAMIAAHEKSRRAEMGCPVRKLGRLDSLLLMVADGLQAWMHVRHFAPHLLIGGRWPETKARIIALAWQTGVGAQVEGMLK